MRRETKEHFTNILDSITGADGGARFINYKEFVEVMDDRAQKGDLAAEQIIELVKQFSRLINTSQKVT
jgi:hypothetical protein